MKSIKTQIKLLDAHLAAKDIMYVRQHAFDFRDRPGKKLARVLAEVPQKKLSIKMKMKDVKVTDQPDRNLEVLVDYYRALCSANP